MHLHLSVPSVNNNIFHTSYFKCNAAQWNVCVDRFNTLIQRSKATSRRASAEVRFKKGMIERHRDGGDGEWRLTGEAGASALGEVV